MDRARITLGRGVVALLVLVLFIEVVPLYMRLAVTSRTYDSAAEAPHAQVAVVLGASVVAGKPSPILAERADAGIELYRLGKVQKVLVTGDNGALSHDEVTPVRKYLLDAGVAPEDIFLDHAGFDTYSSIYRARAIFGARSAVIVTQDFHLPRALWIARALDLDAYGFTAGGSGSLYDTLREIPASFKALLDVALHREPTYLGDPIPLEGSGEATWY